ncbi:hypothetical protein F5B20DRAFT_228531 [Whalleya microplaca]|nr:hypothetical protein F5B20DRAFT_228531 [Whalleya microplaca]
MKKNFGDTTTILRAIPIAMSSPIINQTFSGEVPGHPIVSSPVPDLVDGKQFADIYSAVQGKRGNDHVSAKDNEMRIKLEPTTPGPMDISDVPASTTLQVNFPFLHKAAASESVDILDHSKRIGTNILEEILQQLNKSKDERDASVWITSLKSLKRHFKTPQTIIGIVGSTGHGKSSLINALLEERRLVPTNCVRACTAVITEISWNPSNNPDRCYIANIEFISADDWLCELEYLYHDLIQSTGAVTGDSTNRETDAGVAWAKIKAVYPNLTKERLVKTDARTLTNDPAVRKVLGTTKRIYSDNADTFYEGIEQFVDSKVNKTVIEESDDESEEDDKTRQMELWPLIKVVRINTKADVLSTGAVIVDLPGVEDSNAARAAIASKYIEKCDSIWVVAAITRATNDRAAKKLLGQSFKQQLQYDGNYSNVTFICSKTDDIAIGEAADSLGLAQQLKKLRRKEETLREWESAEQLQVEGDKSRESSLTAYNRELDQRLAQWEKLETRHRKGETVSPPKEPSRKRKITTQRSRGNKRSKVDATGTQGNVLSYTSANDFWDDLEKDMPKFPEGQTLADDHIRSMIDHLRSKKNTALEEMENLENKIEAGMEVGCKLSSEYSDEHSSLLSLCIHKRNEYARRAMRKDFALGVKELDHENSQRENPDNFDPERDIRDYKKVAQSLPVFCVSSRAYQDLCGRLEKDEHAYKGFLDSKATEIPQLQAHAKDLTREGRLHSGKTFLNGLLQILNSLYIWSSSYENQVQLSDAEKQGKKDQIKVALMDLGNDIRGVLETLVHEYEQIIAKQLFGRFESSVMIASEEAINIANKWPQKKKGDGGLPFVSYKATCRRSGVFSGKFGPKNFNEELVNPLKQSLANTWEDTFEQKIPKVMDRFTEVVGKLIQDFHGIIKARIQKTSTFTDQMILQTQLRTRTNGIKRAVTSFSREVTALRREAHRDFTPMITLHMTETYLACVEETGKGCFARMQDRMLGDLVQNGTVMFTAATEPVKAKLANMCETLHARLEATVANILDGMNLDYSNVITGQDDTFTSEKTRDEVFKLLEEVDDRFRDVPID